MTESDERKTGCHVKNQLAVWDSLLECRIRLQKALVAANCLPREECWSSLSQNKSSLNPLQEESNASIGDLTQSLVQLHTILIKSLPGKKGGDKSSSKSNGDVEDDDDEEIDSDEIPDTDDEEGGKGKKVNNGNESMESDEMSEGEDENSSLNKSTDHGQGDEDDEDEDESMDISKNNEDDEDEEDSLLHLDIREGGVKSIDSVIAKEMEKVSPKKNSILDEWFNRTRFSAAGGLESFEQPPLAQIAAILGNKKRLIKRTQLKRCDYNIVGEKVVDAEAQNEEKDKDLKSASDDIVDRENRLEDKELNYDTQIFNDDDFYHQLLKELIDSKSSDSNESLTLTKKWMAIQKMRGKMKKVETRASKGRKIRFKVHKDIVNFMAPVPLTTMDEDTRKQIYSSVFQS